jgi:hypothetical protein
LEPVPSHPDPLVAARRIIELYAAMDREVLAGNYEFAAALRDERERLREGLKQAGEQRILRNLEVHTSSRGLPIIDGPLQVRGGAVDAALAQALSAAPTSPIRWLLAGEDVPPVATLRQVLDTGSLNSDYYAARFPVLSYATMRQARIPGEWVSACQWDESHSLAPVIWTIANPDWLAGVGVLDPILERLAAADAQFVACVASADSAEAQRLASPPGTTVIRV